MYKTSVKRAVLLSFSVLLSCQLTSLKAAEFHVTKVTLSETTARYEFAANIPAGDTATLTITLDKDTHADAIFNSLSLSTSVPKKLAITTDTSTVITAEILPPTNDRKVTLSYTRPVLSAEKDLIRYKLDLDTYELNGFATIKDESNSDTKWLNAVVEIRFKAGKLTFTGATMKSGETISLPAEEVKKYLVKKETSVNRFRTGDPDPKFNTEVTKTYRTYRLTNSLGMTQTPLPSGRIRIFKGEIFLYARGLPMLNAKETVDLYGAEFSEMTATSSKVTDQLFEAKSLENGMLTIRKWEGYRITVTNKSPTFYQIRLGATSDIPHDVVEYPGSPLRVFLTDLKTENFESITLLDIVGDKLAALLNKVRQVETGAKKEVASDAAAYYKNLIKKREQSESLNAAKTELTKIKESLATSTPARDVTLIQAKIEEIEKRIKDVEKAEQEEILKLLDTAFPKPKQQPTA